MRNLKRFFRFYKWHLFFLALISICVIFVFSNLTQNKDPDLTLCYVAKSYINVQTFNDNKKTIELLLHDANGDNEKTVSIGAYAVDLESDLLETFDKLVEKDSYDIFIAERTAFKNHSDKSIFITATDYVNLSTSPLETLKDDDGRVYAVSLENNDFVKRLGIVDSTDLFIAAVGAKDGKELSTARKNGRNIAGYILTQE